MEKIQTEFDDWKIKFLLFNKKLLIQSDDSNPQFLYYNFFDISLFKICFQDESLDKIDNKTIDLIQKKKKRIIQKKNALILKFEDDRQLILELNTFDNFIKELMSIYKGTTIERDSKNNEQENLVNELKEKNKENKELIEKNKKLQSDYEETKSELETLKNYIKSLNSYYKKKNEEFNKSKIKESKNEIQSKNTVNIQNNNNKSLGKNQNISGI